MNVSDDINERVSRLISDLGHFCEARGLDFVMLVQKGVGRWRSEMDADDLEANGLAREFTATLTLRPLDPEKKRPMETRDLGSERAA